MIARKSDFIALTAAQLFCFILLVSAANADVMINEIMYDAEGSDANKEWIEIYNNGSEEINFSNGKLFEAGTNHALTLLLGNGTIPVGGYAIIAENASAFLTYYPDYTGPLFDSTFSLSNTNETIAIKDSAGSVLDELTYSGAWGASGTGNTLERNASGWFESVVTGGTPGARNSVYSFTEEPAQTPVNETGNATGATPPENTAGEQAEAPIAPQNQEADTPVSMEILTAPDTMNFGDYSTIRAKFNSGSTGFEKIRFAAYIYKPSWISRDINANGTTLRNSPYNSNAAAEISGIAAGETYYLVLPLFLKCNTEEYVDATYTARVRAYAFESGEWTALAENDRNIFVSKESETCKKEIAKEASCINKTIEKNCTGTTKMLREEALEINITHPEIIFLGENFTTTVFVKNTGETLRDIEIYSYMYEHGTIISSGFDGAKWGNARTANSRKITLDANDFITIVLLTRAKENASAEKYTYKVRFDDLADSKKSEERISLIELEARNISETAGINETISNATEKESRITGNLLAKNAAPQKLSFLDRIIYKIKSWLT